MKYKSDTRNIQTNTTRSFFIFMSFYLYKTFIWISFFAITYRNLITKYFLNMHHLVPQRGLLFCQIWLLINLTMTCDIQFKWWYVASGWAMITIYCITWSWHFYNVHQHTRTEVTLKILSLSIEAFSQLIRLAYSFIFKASLQ